MVVGRDSSSPSSKDDPIRANNNCTNTLESYSECVEAILSGDTVGTIHIRSQAAGPHLSKNVMCRECCKWLNAATIQFGPTTIVRSSLASYSEYIETKRGNEAVSTIHIGSQADGTVPHQKSLLQYS